MGKAFNTPIPQKPSSSVFSISKLAYVACFLGGLLLGCQQYNKFTQQQQESLQEVVKPVAQVDAWDTRRYYPEDFEKHFGLRLIHQLEVPDSLKKYVDAHDIRKDPTYSQNIELSEAYARVYGPFLDHVHDDDRRIYVKWAGPEKHFGVFADTYLPPNAFIAEYSGILTNSSFSTDYEWDYYSHDIVDDNGNVLKLGVDSQLVGNIARFVNHDDDPNCGIVYVPWRNRWRLVYVANKAIFPGEELSISYGPNYWESRSEVVKV
ncbi:uncharacterized protein SPPG_02720 [Spizellomyces punctatus DAOM BR117]|uniref:SET domain-containing protein n=1 Tax=Spizellomyces punctatus (strain DAOM BR117) TaxID=645134 RepID=A0A0L0HN43_SPIPD|nr:uncharacterized protein SPPG_02720 [Spizellomyces punctatus DAOM BR117]KND02239.1 hypothetical protein SPPG_02720 [Spizellomyces punctatus DAOM BR117]|eukprot:XP_016610278.1 hypothetical protein SPPG_02720 [Spizellomyces punctatus DAOM BR117]